MNNRTIVNKEKWNHRIGAPLILIFISPLISELLFGSTPLSRISYLLPQIFFYGSGALLVRETITRYKMGWISVIVLGVAFGIVEEALALQTVFNPKYFGLDISYGRLWGINWTWSFFIIGYHAIWSITIPIIFTELIFEEKAQHVWLSKTGYLINTVVFIFMTVSFYFIFKEQLNYTAPILQYFLAIFIVIATIIVSFIFNRPGNRWVGNSPLNSLVIGISSIVSATIWFWLFSLLFVENPIMPAWMIMLLGTLVLLGVMIIIFRRLNNMKPLHLFILASGGLLISMLFGLQVLITEGNNLDIYFHIFLMILTVVLLILFRLKFNKPLRNE